MASEELQIYGVEVVSRLDNVWVHIHLASALPEVSHDTIRVHAESSDGLIRVAGVALDDRHPSELFVETGGAEREVVSVGTEHVARSVLTVAFPADAFSGLGADPAFTVRVEHDGDEHAIDIPVSHREPPEA